jgi:hypothetical protein
VGPFFYASLVETGAATPVVLAQSTNRGTNRGTTGGDKRVDAQR